MMKAPSVVTMLQTIFTKPYKGWQVEFDGDTKHWGLRLTRKW